MPAPLRRTYPLDKAVAETVAGIEQRANRIIYPRFLRLGLALRGVLGPRSERSLVKAMPEVERLSKDQRPRGATPSP
jgi:hypothetical protein